MVLSEEVSFMKVYDKNILINTCFSRTSLSVCISAFHAHAWFVSRWQRGLSARPNARAGRRRWVQALPSRDGQEGRATQESPELGGAARCCINLLVLKTTESHPGDCGDQKPEGQGWAGSAPARASGAGSFLGRCIFWRLSAFLDLRLLLVSASDLTLPPPFGSACLLLCVSFL